MNWLRKLLDNRRDWLTRAEYKRRCEQLETITVELLYQVMRDGKHPNTSIPLDINQYLPTLRARALKMLREDQNRAIRLGERLTNFEMDGL